MSGLASPILAGDFNLPVDSAIYREYWSGYRDAFSDAGWGFGYTEWPRVRRPACRHPDRPRFDGPGLAMPLLLGRARTSAPTIFR